MPELFERYFRRNEGTTDYGVMDSAVTLSGNFEVSTLVLHDGLDVFRALGSSLDFQNRVIVFQDGRINYRTETSGQELNASIGSLSENVFHLLTIRKIGSVTDILVDGVIVTSGSPTGDFSIDQIFRQSTSVGGSGILADLRISSAGVPIHSWAMNDNTSTMVDSIGGNNISIINGNPTDWGLFQQQTTGEWLGQELVTQAVWETPNVIGSQWAFSNDQWSLTGDGSANALRLLATASNPDSLRISGNLINLSGSGLAVDNNLSAVVTLDGPYSFDLLKSDIGVLAYLRSSGVVNATIDKPSIKEVLNVA